jgi:integrase
LKVERAFAEVAGRLILGQTKTGEARKIALPEVIVQSITDHLEQFGPGNDGLLFSAPEGGPIRRSVWRSREWLPALRGAGIDYMPPHSLRHFAVSFALTTGAKIAEAAELVGHSDPMTTARVYSHVLPGVARQVADKVSKAYVQANAGSTGMRHEGSNLRHVAEGGTTE